MAISLYNSLEGGTPGDPIEIDNTGPNRFDAVAIGGAGTAMFTGQAAHGVVAADIANAAGTAVYLEWAATLTSQTGTGVASVLYLRTSVYLPALPASEVALLRAVPAGSGQRWRICLDTAGHLSVRNAANTVVAASTATLTAGAWWRIEAAMTGSAAAGTAEVRAYLGDATSPSFTLGPLTGLSTGGAVYAVRYGHASAATATTRLLLDDIATSDDTWIGPGCCALLSTLTELFDAGTLDPLVWNAPGTSVVAHVLDGACRVEGYQHDASIDFSALFSVKTWMVDRIWWQYRQVQLTADDGGPTFWLFTDDGSWAKIGIFPSGVSPGIYDADTGNSDSTTVPYDPVQHRWFQIVRSGGTTTFSSSPDGAAWTTLLSTPTVLAQPVTVEFDGAAGSGYALIDNINAVPAPPTAARDGWGIAL